MMRKNEMINMILKKTIFSKVLFCFFILFSVTACSKQKDIFYENRLIFITDQTVDVDKIKSEDNRYKNIDVIFVSSDAIDEFAFQDNDIKAIDQATLQYDNVKNKVLEFIKNDDYVIFIKKKESIATLAYQLGQNMTEYDSSQQLVTFTNDYFVLKYTDQ